jgi:hypothetical protein
MDTSKGVRVKSVRFIGREDVYNMEVECHHNFSVNGGLIIHNCKDEERYFLHTVFGSQEPSNPLAASVLRGIKVYS